MNAGNIKLNILIIPKLVLGVAKNYYCHYCNYFSDYDLDNIVITMIFQLYVDLYLLIAMIIFKELFVNWNGDSEARCKTVQNSMTTDVVLQQLHLVHGPLQLLCSMLFCLSLWLVIARRRAIRRV